MVCVAGACGTLMQVHGVVEPHCPAVGLGYTVVPKGPHYFMPTPQMVA